MPEQSNGLESKLEELQKEYSKTKYNKATNKHLGILRKKIATIKKEMLTSKSRGRGAGFFVKRSGDATVALLGLPSAGKSSLINVLANTRSRTASYAFTTTSIVPGMMTVSDAHIQVFDMPGIIEGAHMGLGGGRAVIAAMRVSDLIVFVVDVTDISQLDLLLAELHALNINVNKSRPKVRVLKSDKAIGIHIDENKSGINDRDVITVLSSFGIKNAYVRIEEKINVDDLISLISGRSYYMKAIVALNKIDLKSDYAKVASALSSKYAMEVIPVCATESFNLEKLREAIYRNLNIMTIYLKPHAAKEPPTPLVLKRGSSVGYAASKLHTEIIDQLKCAYVSGPSAKFARQRVGVTHVLQHGDVITFIKET